MVDEILQGREDLVDRRLSAFDHDVEVSPFLSMLRSRPLSFAGKQVRLVGLIRDGRQAVRSGMTNGWYWNPEGDPTHWVNLQPRFERDRFAACCQFWTWTYQRLAEWQATMFRLEDLTYSQSLRNKLLVELDLACSNELFPRKNRTDYDQPQASEREALPWPDPFPDSRLWTVAQHEVFDRHCGELMDKYYPGWREGESGS